MAVEIICGDALSVLAGLPAASVHCCITSPPYYALRDYGTATWEGGDARCDHRESRPSRTAASMAASGLEGGTGNVHRSHIFRRSCGRCGAQRIDAQIGTEATPQDYVAHLVEVFRGVWRVLRDDGTCWIVIGDSYAGSWGNQGRKPERGTQRPINGPMMQNLAAGYPERGHSTGTIRAGMPPAKNLLGIPWRLAFALQDDGWILRAEIVWAKTAPMPESIGDRVTRSHETIFMLAKKPVYFYDQEAIREENSSAEQLVHNLRYAKSYAVYDARAATSGQPGNVNNVGIHSRPGSAGRNKRSVWTIGPQPLAEEHYAAFPQKLVEPMILAGTSEAGCCPRCLAPWRREVEREKRGQRRPYRGSDGRHPRREVSPGQMDTSARTTLDWDIGRTTTGWGPSCRCDAGPPTPCRVLDCFGGSGTVGLVGRKLGRSAVLIELNPDYVKLAQRRIDSTPDTLFSAAVLADEGAAAR